MNKSHPGRCLCGEKPVIQLRVDVGTFHQPSKSIRLPLCAACYEMEQEQAADMRGNYVRGRSQMGR